MVICCLFLRLLPLVRGRTVCCCTVALVEFFGVEFLAEEGGGGFCIMCGSAELRGFDSVLDWA